MENFALFNFSPDTMLSMIYNSLSRLSTKQPHLKLNLVWKNTNRMETF